MKPPHAPASDLAVPVARDDTGKLWGPEAAPRGPGYFCPVCAGAVVLHRGEIRRAHFAHKAGNESRCTFIGESAAHRAAIMMIVQAVQAHCAGRGSRPVIEYVCPRCDAVTGTELLDDAVVAATPELPALDGRLRIDVGLGDASGSLVMAVEVLHGHPVPRAKGELLGDAGIRWIEVEAHQVLREPTTWRTRSGLDLPECSRPACVAQDRAVQRASALGRLPRPQAASWRAPGTYVFREPPATQHETCARAVKSLNKALLEARIGVSRESVRMWRQCECGQSHWARLPKSAYQISPTDNPVVADIRDIDDKRVCTILFDEVAAEEQTRLGRRWVLLDAMAVVLNPFRLVPRDTSRAAPTSHPSSS